MATKTTIAKSKANITNQALQITQGMLTYISTYTTPPRLVQVELPPDTIEGGSINNLEQFQSSLTKLFSQIKLKNRNIVLSLPEHQTFLKTTEVADLNSDVHEAILWKIQQYLPQSSDQMTLDWAVIESPDAPPHIIQVAAVPQKMINEYLRELNSYVQIAAIETPSLTLSRIAQAIPHPCLLIAAEEEIVLAISNLPGSIELTSISDHESVHSVIKEMLTYYQSKYQINLEQIYITGSQANLIQTKISNAQILSEPTQNPQLAMLYALAKKPVAPPQDSYTLNLAPSHMQLDFQAAVSQDVYRKTIVLSLIFILVLNLVVTGFTIYTWMQQQQLQQIVGSSGPSIASLTQDGNSQITRDQLNTVLKVAPNRSQIATLLKEISTYSNSVSVTNIIIDSDNQVITMSGISPTQDALLELKSSLENSPAFSEVRLPISIFEKRTDIPFTLSINWQAPQ